MHQDDVRTKIQTSQLINRLTDHALGENDVKLEASQVRAIEVLLRKTLPDLNAVGFDGGDDMQAALASIIAARRQRVAAADGE